MTYKGYCQHISQNACHHVRQEIEMIDMIESDVLKANPRKKSIRTMFDVYKMRHFLSIDDWCQIR